MPFDHFEQYARDEGYCCALVMLKDREKWDTKVLAEDAKISERAVRFWREDLRKGKVACKNCSNCQLAALLKGPDNLAIQTILGRPDKDPDSASGVEAPALPSA